MLLGDQFHCVANPVGCPVLEVCWSIHTFLNMRIFGLGRSQVHSENKQLKTQEATYGIEAQQG
jgi:hypothetical protein